MKLDICFFPGQGAQYAGMGRDLHAMSQNVRDLFEAASAASGRDLKHLIFDGSEEDLKDTDNTQVAVTLVNIAAWTALKEHGLMEREGYSPVYAGFSLGELAAYHAAGIIDLETLFRIAAMRGRLMAEAAEEATAVHGSLGMAAVIGRSFAEIERMIADAGIEHVYPSNDNGPSQVVIAGVEKSIERLTLLLKEAGTRRVVPLKVSAPFHTPFLVPAARRFKEMIADFTFRDPVRIVYTNVSGTVVGSGTEAKENLSRQQISPVRWTTTIQVVAGSGDIGGCFEAGPGKVLSGLWKSSGSDIACRPAGTAAEIDALAAQA